MLHALCDHKKQLDLAYYFRMFFLIPLSLIPIIRFYVSSGSTHPFLLFVCFIHTSESNSELYSFSK